MNVKQSLFCASVTYFNGQLYRFILDVDAGITLEKAPEGYKPKILIVSRDFYQESAQTYPIENKTELRKLLKFESQNKAYFFNLNASTDGSTPVNKWLFNANIPNALIRLPETVVLASLINPNEVLEVETTPSLYVAKSQQIISSSLKSNMISSHKMFAMASGISNTSNKTTVLAQEFGNQLYKGIEKSPFSLLKNFFNLNKLLQHDLLVAKVLLPILTVITVYLFASSSYLAFKDNHLTTKLSEQSEVIDAALHQQQSYDSNITRHNILIDFLSAQSLNSPSWFVVAEAFEHAEIQNIRQIAGRIVIRGSTAKATELLEKISELPMVENAKFDFPTRSDRGQEHFVIGFSQAPFDEKIFLAKETINNKITEKK